MTKRTLAAYEAWRRAADNAGPLSEHVTDMNRRHARVVRLKDKYEALLTAENARLDARAAAHEERYERRAAFGRGVRVVNVFTGKSYRT